MPSATIAWGIYARSCVEVDAFVRACMAVDPTARLTAKSALQHVRAYASSQVPGWLAGPTSTLVMRSVREVVVHKRVCVVSFP